MRVSACGKVKPFLGRDKQAYFRCGKMGTIQFIVCVKILVVSMHNFLLLMFVTFLNAYMCPCIAEKNVLIYS